MEPVAVVALVDSAPLRHSEVVLPVVVVVALAYILVPQALGSPSSGVSWNHT